MAEKRVLITGSAGRIGRAVVDELMRRGITVRGFDRAANPRLTDQVIGDLTDVPALEKALRDVGTLIHLAATPDDDDDFAGQIVPSNIIGVHNVLESSRAAAVERFILASSVQTVWYERQRGPYPIRVDTRPTPRYWYAATKMFLEAAGRAFVEKYGVKALIVRLGWCPRTKEQATEIAASSLNQDIYFSPGDAGRFFARAVEAQWSFDYEIVFAVSRAVSQPRFDLEPAKRLVGYEPGDQWPTGVEDMLGG